MQFAWFWVDHSANPDWTIIFDKVIFYQVKLVDNI